MLPLCASVTSWCEVPGPCGRLGVRTCLRLGCHVLPAAALCDEAHRGLLLSSAPPVYSLREIHQVVPIGIKLIQHCLHFLR
jgi:hypothetical protein